MNCNEVRALIDAYVDNELDLTTSLAVGAHLETCAGCTTTLRNRQLLRKALADNALYKRPSPLAARQLRRSLPRQAFRWQWLAAAACLLSGLLFIGAVFRLNAISADEQIMSSVLASHLRSLMADHLTDVLSSDQHTVKPWFDGKLDYAPTVVDLSEAGFPLVGGRLDYVQNNPVAALVYRSDKHIINVFVWPAGNVSNSGSAAVTRQGYHLLRGQAGGTIFWIVSDLEPDKLETFARLFQSRLS